MTATIHEMRSPGLDAMDAAALAALEGLEGFGELAAALEGVDGVPVAPAAPLPPVPEVIAPLASTLYAVEEELAVYLDTAEFVSKEQEAQFLVDLGAAMRAAVEKRDNVGRFMAHLDGQIDHADKEIERLAARRERYAAALVRMEGYVTRILESFGRDGRGRWQRLEGETHTFSLRGCPPSVAVIKESEIPDSFKMAAVRMPAELWAEVLDGLDFELRARVVEAVGNARLTVMLSAIKTAIDARVEVPGADLVFGKNTLVRK